MKLKHLALFAAVSVAIGLPVAPDRQAQAPSLLENVVQTLAGAPQAQAQSARRAARRTARRTSRRVTRRHNYYSTLPRGCGRVVIRGYSYWHCGGVYYQEQIEAGSTVYIIVTP